jgi:8-oxo-dGTP pyrophosphatase MutT (NUDIX family)
MSKATPEKVIAYITQGNKLLVFRHTAYLEAGIQVPAGTTNPGEQPGQAVLREAYEETGLEDLQLRAFLGVQEFDLTPFGRAEVQRRYFFHLEYHDQAPATWHHFENYPSEGDTEPIEFELFWVAFSGDVPELFGDQGAMLTRLEKQMCHHNVSCNA